MQIIKNSFHFCLLSSPVISCSLLDRQYSALLYQETQTSHCVSHDLTKSLSLTRIIFPVFYFFTPLSSWIKSNKCVKQLRKSLNRRPVKWHSQFFLTVLFSFRKIKNLLKKKKKTPKSRIEVIIVEQGEPRPVVQSNGEGGQCKHSWVNV